MDNEQTIIDLIDSINADKSLSQPWKNYSLSDLRRALAVLKMASGSMHQLQTKTPHTALDDAIQTHECICKPGARNGKCRALGHVG